jgi:hypothetical protein
MNKRFTLKTSLLVSICIVVCAGCTSDPPESAPKKTVSYVGEFETFRTDLFEKRVDTVELLMTGEKYLLFHDTHRTRICDSEGDIFAFGRPSVNIASAAHRGTNCDTLRLPFGLFSATYRGDSVYLERDADTGSLNITYKFRLTK